MSICLKVIHRQKFFYLNNHHASLWSYVYQSLYLHHFQDKNLFNIRPSLRPKALSLLASYWILLHCLKVWNDNVVPQRLAQQHEVLLRETRITTLDHHQPILWICDPSLIGALRLYQRRVYSIRQGGPGLKGPLRNDTKGAPRVPRF